jgi:hypothetical protein
MCVFASVHLAKGIRRDAQYHAMARRGITFPESAILRMPSANSNPEVGTIEAGKWADITELKRVKFVMKGGVVYKNDVH